MNANSVTTTMSAITLDWTELVRELGSPEVDERLSAAHGTPMAVVGLGGAADVDPLMLRPRVDALNSVLVGVLHRGERASQAAAGLLDVTLYDESITEPPSHGVGVPDVGAAIDVLTANVTAHPLAAATLAVLLRGSGSLSVSLGLAAESAAYSTLQSGPEFATWLASRTPRNRAPAPDPVVLADRVEDLLHLTLNSPEIHNAFSRRMRDQLCELLRLADADPSITRLLVDGAGPSFCSGGFLDEFGQLPDPATAHVVRTTRSAARLMHRLADRTQVHLHGTVAGAGIELAAFAEVVVADPGTSISLPELSLGLIPGAGGTVSLPSRIGRQRTAWLGLSGAKIDASTAAAWGLVDVVQPRAQWTPPMA
jgi:enoyl-CoA hydratase/carnithine racemase